jgi:hypothetical protein
VCSIYHTLKAFVVRRRHLKSEHDIDTFTGTLYASTVYAVMYVWGTVCNVGRIHSTRYGRRRGPVRSERDVPARHRATTHAGVTMRTFVFRVMCRA